MVVLVGLVEEEQARGAIDQLGRMACLCAVYSNVSSANTTESCYSNYYAAT